MIIYFLVIKKPTGLRPVGMFAIIIPIGIVVIIVAVHIVPLIIIMLILVEIIISSIGTIMRPVIKGPIVAMVSSTMGVMSAIVILRFCSGKTKCCQKQYDDYFFHKILFLLLTNVVPNPKRNYCLHGHVR
jgi:hypothetical protein